MTGYDFHPQARADLDESLSNSRSVMVHRQKIPTTVASRAPLERATAAYFRDLPAEAAREELNLATALDASAEANCSPKKGSMERLMDDYSSSAVTCAYEIDRTVEVHLASDRVFRLEVVKAVKGCSTVHYDVRYYERQTLYKAPNGVISTEPVVSATQFHVWVPDVNLPWVNQDSAEAALAQDLRWLAERRNNPNRTW